MRILITGCSGFIGFHLSLFLLKKNYKIYGIDTMNSYYDPSLKYNRLKVLKKYKNFYFNKFDISNRKKINFFFNKNNIDCIINLAAYAGVQYSLKNPDVYFKTNEIGFYNLLENARIKKIKKIIFASSSSVAGNANFNFFKETDNTDSPISLYAATKKNNEILAHFYATHYKIKIIGVRFFTVYGPYGRPDLSIYKFAESIKNNKKIFLYNNGNHYRDFTYIDDVVKCLFKLINVDKFHNLDENKNSFFQIFNLGGGSKIKITNIINILEKFIKKKAILKNAPLRKGDVVFSRSSTKKLSRNINYHPDTKISTGLKLFISWFQKKNLRKL
jgi:UDP-glucuronate 4-epimerase